MRVFIVLFILIFSLQSWTKADDIKDFEIEGMSIGDSLLDFFSEDEILNSIRPNQYAGSDGKFVEIEIYKENHSFLKTYEGMQIFYKKNDKNYKIYSLSGGIFYGDNINACFKQQKEIEQIFSEIFKSTRKRESKRKHVDDVTGKSYIYFITYYFTNGNVVEISCYDYSKHLNRNDYLLVSVDTKELTDWLP